MRIGKLDRRIVIEQQTTAKDDWNFDTTTWTTFVTLWASKMDKGATEREEVDRQTALTRTIWNIRYTSGVNATMRISFGGLYYYITGVEEVGRKQEMNIYTELRN